jgi:hypothetical protein
MHGQGSEDCTPLPLLIRSGHQNQHQQQQVGGDEESCCTRIHTHGDVPVPMLAGSAYRCMNGKPHYFHNHSPNPQRRLGRGKSPNVLSAAPSSSALAAATHRSMPITLFVSLVAAAAVRHSSGALSLAGATRPAPGISWLET